MSNQVFVDPWADFVTPAGLGGAARRPQASPRYREVAPELLGDAPEARVAWDQLVSLLDDWVARPERRGDLVRLRRYGASAGCWKQTG